MTTKKTTNLYRALHVLEIYAPKFPLNVKSDPELLFDYLTRQNSNRKPKIAKPQHQQQEDESKLYNVEEYECPKCFKKKAKKTQQQTRGFDEAESVFLKCICGKEWSLDNV